MTTLAIQTRASRALRRRADRHTCGVQRWIATRTASSRRVEFCGVPCTCSGLPLASRNLALGTPDVPAARTARTVRSVCTFFREQTVPWQWWVPRWNAPSPFLDRLRACHLTLTETKPLMIARPPWTLPAASPSIDVRPASTHADLRRATTIYDASFGRPGATAAALFLEQPTAWLQARSRARLFLAGRDGGEPTAMGCLIRHADGVGVYMMATCPSHQRRGLGTAVLRHLLHQAQAEGAPYVALTASPAGESLYRRFGFRQIGTYEVYALEETVRRRDAMVRA